MDKFRNFIPAVATRIFRIKEVFALHSLHIQTKLSIFNAMASFLTY